METIHIDKYDAANPADERSEAPTTAAGWRERLRERSADLGRDAAAAAGKVAAFVKRRPAATAVAALGVGLFASRGKHRLLKAAYGAFALPFLKRQLAEELPAG